MPGRRDERRPAERGPHALRPLRRCRPRVRHRDAADALPLDQLPRHRGVLRPRLAHRRRLLLLPRRAHAAPDPLPLQQRPDRRRRPLLLRPRRRRLLDPRLGPGEARARLLRVPRRPLVHEDHRRAEGHPDRGPLLRPPGDDRRGAPGHAEEHLEGGEERQALLVRRVLPVGGLGRPDELPEEPLDRRGGGRRLDDLPQDRVPGAPEPLRRPLGEREGGRLRHRPRELPRALERLRRAPGRGGGEVAELRGQRLVADRLAPPGGGPRAGRGEDLRLRPRLRREPRGGEVGAAGGREQEARAGAPRALPDDGAGGRRSRRPARVLDGDAVEVHGEVRRRASRPDGQHLEPLPVHGDLQHVALGLVLRDRHRPRHGLPRLEPGPAGLRAPHPGAGAGAHPRHRGHPEAGRQRLPPVPAAHEAGEQRRRVRASTTTRSGSSRERRRTSRSRATSGS